MIVPFVAAGTALFYLSAVPVHLAFALRAGENGGWGAGVSVFEGRFARAAAERNLGREKRRPKRKISLPEKKLPLFKSALKAFRHVLRHTQVNALSLRGTLSLGDAALTAVFCGALGSLISALATAMQARLECALQPDFSSPRIELTGELSGIVTLRAGHIILAALIGAIDYGNGRLSQWTDTRLKTS